MLSVRDVRSGYGKGDVLHGVSLDLAEGEVIGVLGRNGVGKTTFMRTVIGLLPTRSGHVRFDGADVTNVGADRRARRGIGYVPQGRDIFPRLTVRDNLTMGEMVGGSSSALRYDLVFSYFPILQDRAGQRGGTLSGGEQQMLAIGRALVGGPRLLLLDEPSEGVQPSVVQEIGHSLARLQSQENLTILIVDQNLGLVQELASRAYVMEKGSIVAVLDGDEVQDTERVSALLAL